MNLNEDKKSNVTLEEYAKFTPTTFIIPEYQVDAVYAYLFSGVAAEAGEVAGEYGKFVRGDFDINELKKRASKEIGDVMYFITQLCNELDLSLPEILQGNMDKLKDRLARNVIKGSGNDR